MASLVPTEGNDVLVGDKSADTIDAGAGNDIVNSGAGDDVVYGGLGDDQINAGSGDDFLEGGAGNDVLNGGGGSDTFSFNFTVDMSAGTEVLTYGLIPQAYDINNNGVSQSEFTAFKNAYDAWLQANAPDDYTYNMTATNPVNSAGDPELVDGAVASVTTTNGQMRYWEPSIEVETLPVPVITASDGDDAITSFQEAGPNVDTIELHGLAGLTDAQLDTLFDLTQVDTNGDTVVDASKLVWDGGSIVIGGRLDWGTDVLSFFHDSQVELL